MNNNNDIRERMKSSGIKQWEVAEELNVSEATMVRWMRTEIPAAKKREIFAAIENLEEMKDLLDHLRDRAATLR